MGQEWAWQALYRSLAPRVLGYLRARARDDAEDLLGEVMMQVVRDLSQFEGGERDLQAWVMTIAHHRLLDHRRRRLRRPFDAVDPDALDHRLGGDSEREALDHLAGEEIRRALRRLPESQRNVVLLRVIGDLSVEQVATAIDKSPGAVKQLQRRALESLRREARPQEGVTA